MPGATDRTAPGLTAATSATVPPATMRIPADLGRLAGMRAMVREAAQASGATSDIVDDLVQAVDEAATNTIVHGYRGGTGWIDVRLEQVGTDIVVTVEDAAVTFDPTALPDPDMGVPAHVRGPGGMGIRLMRLATDAMHHAPRTGGGNILTMTRSLEPRPKEDG